MARINPKIAEFQKRDTPIIYSNVTVTSKGNLELREQAGNSLKQRIVKGYGVIWGSKNDYGEVFVKGCFAKSISELGPDSNSNYKIKFRNRHGIAVALFSILKEDDTGLYFETKPLDATKEGNDLLVQLESGTVNNFSIGFKHVWDKVEWDEENEAIVNLEARLFEISGVDIPSDMETHQVRSGEDDVEKLQDEVEDFITSLAYSRQLEARQIFTRCMSLRQYEPPDLRSKALETNEPTETGLDLKFLTKNFSLND